jgi:hypothetical protein
MRVLEVTPENLPEAWEHAAPWIERAKLRGRGRYPLPDIRADGCVYKFVQTGRDAGLHGDKDIFTMVRSRKFEQMGGDLILRGAKLTIGRIQPSLIRMEAIGNDGASRYLIAEEMTREVGSGDDLIFDANYKIYDANWPIAGVTRAVPQIFDWRVAGPRDPGLYLQVRTLGGRVTIDSIQGLAAIVG